MSGRMLGDAAVLFIGRSGAGKSEAAQYLIDRVPRAGLYPMAEEIKVIARALGWDGEKGVRGRKLLQDLGTVGRQYDEDMWVRIAVEKWRADYDRGFWMEVFVADDVRYQNEIDYIVTHFVDTWIVRIDREEGDELNGAGALHVSEQLWPKLPYDFKIDNNGLLQLLHQEMQGKIREMGLSQIGGIL